MCDPCVDVKDDSSSKVICRRLTRHRIVRGTYFQDQGIPDGQIRNEGPWNVSLILGMQVSRDRLKGTLDINQGNYVKAILQRQGFVDTISVSTPGTGKSLDLKL